MQNTGVLYEYELILLCKKNSFSPYFFNFSPEYNERMALDVFRYAIEYYLNWSPKEASIYLDKDVLDMMKLTQILKFIRFPCELDPNRDFFYIAHLLYPKIIHFDEKELILRTYKEVLSGKLYKFPKEYLSDSMGMTRACICLQYMISQYLQFSSIEDMYHFFSTSEGTKTLKKYRLYAICTDMFEYPIDFLHESLSTKQKNEFFYRLNRFYLKNKEQLNKIKKEKKKENN